MQVSAEIRWFWNNVPPPKLKEWFRNATKDTCPAGGGEPRVDKYLYDRSQVELGFKRRGAKPGVEVKGLVTAKWGNLTATPFVGPIDLWTKWTSEVLELRSGWTVPIEKIRWLRKFDTAKQFPEEIPLDSKEMPFGNRALPELGCNVELTQITLADNKIWWTLGFESFGNIQTVDKSLYAVATTLATRQPPELGTGLLASYPDWIKENVAAPNSVQELISLNKQIGEAERTAGAQGADFLKRVLSDNLRFRRANGTIVDKAIYFDDLTKPGNATDELQSTDIVPTIYGKLAVVELLVAMKGMRGGKKLDGAFRNIRIFLDEPEKQPRWQLHSWFNVPVPGKG
jgi:hypothetical protein